MSQEQKETKFIATVEGLTQSFDVPVYANSLEHAELLLEEYVDAGFIVERIRPEVTHG